MARYLVLVVVVLLVVLFAWFVHVGRGGLGDHEAPGRVTEQTRPASVVAERGEAVRGAADEMLVAAPRQVLFGDLHVHTTFSFDAFMMSLPLQGGEGTHPPADACDFARFCSALDFWSINDHASSVTKQHWDETVDTIRQCNAVAGSGDTPDTVAFLGWEWTQVGNTPDDHYGHKNVVLRDLEDGKIPTRPIGATKTRALMTGGNPFGGVASGAFLHALGMPRMHGLAKYFDERARAEVCPLGVPVRELPADCAEVVETPAELFAKLDDWGHESIVIPHGTTWGFYTPPGSDWAKQLQGDMHDPDRQTLFEIYSGHGNSEQYRDFAAVDFDEEGVASCPAPSDGYLPTCWRAGEIVRERCLDLGEGEETCDARAATAREHAVAAGPQAHLVVPGAQPEDWLDAGQCTDCAQPAFNYRPKGAAQYVTALSNFDSEDAEPRRFRFGFLASSDNHFARPGTGYKETIRPGFSESRRFASDGDPVLTAILGGPDEPPQPISRPFDRQNTELVGFALMEMERQASYFQTGGLTAVHAEGRNRDAIWDAFQRREVYGTSGPRILLWFDMLNAPGRRGRPLPMGGETAMDGIPIFQARAVGSFEQAPGCPDYAATALGEERLANVCKNECYNPTAERRPITRIDVIRIRPQNRPGEPLDALIEDPWKTFECDGDPAGCAFTFSDPEYPRLGRDVAYYVRAHEAEAPGVNAGGVRCERDAEGRCTSVDLCGSDPNDPCHAPHEPRAWSSPIYVDYLPPGRG